ncbi:DUF6186 family protein [Leifsonia poae]|uniref:DUF6186 family protein n=1 Tax=Leifsonia poae TaxID=110933 RepID=UPI0021DA26F8|nr:DUF6186 family protein [Leifsonia poae]
MARRFSPCHGCQIKQRPWALHLAPFASLLDVVMADRAARLTILLFWWWLGWHFLITPPSP